MKKTDLRESPETERLQLFVYVIPVIGVFPSLWTLYRRQGSLTQRSVSRLAVTLALCWLLAHFLIEAGSHTTESFRISLLLTSSVLTTSYFIVCFGLMVRLWQRQPLWLPGVSRVARILGKHLS